MSAALLCPAPAELRVERGLVEPDVITAPGGARLGAAAAIQVADRFHLQRNLSRAQFFPVLTPVREADTQ